MNMKKHIKYLTTFLILCSVLLHGQSLTCSSTTNIPPSGSVVVNGIKITSSYTGNVKQHGPSHISCVGTSTNPGALWVGQMVVTLSPWAVTWTFDKPVNDLIVLITAAGGNRNENFIFNSNGGAVSIFSDNSCYSTITGNTIISGLDAGEGAGGGGLFKISAPNAYTSLTIKGDGGDGGSLLAVCSASIVEICKAGSTKPVVRNLSNMCPSNTVNLNNAHTGTVPFSASLVWYRNNTHTGSPLTTSAIANAGAGTYYAFYYDESNNCYGPVSNAVNVIIDVCPPPVNCTDSGITSVNLNSLFTGALPHPEIALEWWTSPTRNLPPTPGTKVLDPTIVTTSGTYYAFFYDTQNECYNTDNSTAAVTVNILPPCPSDFCVKEPEVKTGGTPTKVGITIQKKQEIWPENIPNGFLALESKTKGFVITRVENENMIADPKEGMLIYDISADCVKLYNGTTWKCLERGCNE